MPSDYISRSELLHKLTVSESGERYPTLDCDNFPIQYPVRDLIKIIRDQSAASVESVVHCGECECKEESGNNFYYCHHLHAFVPKDFGCVQGKQKDEAE